MVAFCQGPVGGLISIFVGKRCDAKDAVIVWVLGQRNDLLYGIGWLWGHTFGFAQAMKASSWVWSGYPSRLRHPSRDGWIKDGVFLARN